MRDYGKVYTSFWSDTSMRDVSEMARDFPAMEGKNGTGRQSAARLHELFP